MLIQSKKPAQLYKCNIFTIPKSGNLEEVGNYRGITLSAVIAKIINKMLLNRIQPYIDPLLRPNQNGFRSGRSTMAHILELRMLIEGIKSHDLNAVIIFVDFKKAFDSIDRGKMLEMLAAYSIPSIITNTIALFYENTEARIITPDGETEFFKISKGVLQGDTLAPFLFIITLYYIMLQVFGENDYNIGFKLTERRCSREPAVVITDLSYADDIALISQELYQAQELLQRVELEARKIGLTLNTRKTEVIGYNLQQSPFIKTISGETIKEVSNYKSLGAWISISEKEFEIRKALAWTVMHRMKRLWTSNMSNQLKIRAFKGTVETVLLYGSQCWTVDSKLRKRIYGCYTRLCMAQNISWKSKTNNEKLYNGLPKVTDIISERMLNLAGHCVRHKEEMVHNLVLWTPTRGKRRRGRQQLTFVDALKLQTDLESIDEIRSVMMDRGKWKKLSTLG